MGMSSRDRSYEFQRQKFFSPFRRPVVVTTAVVVVIVPFLDTQGVEVFAGRCTGLTVVHFEVIETVIGRDNIIVRVN